MEQERLLEPRLFQNGFRGFDVQISAMLWDGDFSGLGGMLELLV